MNHGSICMLLSAVFFSMMSLGVRLLAFAAPHIHVIEIVFFRSFLSLIGIHLILKKLGLSWKGNRPGLLVIRGIGGFLGMTSYYLCLQQLPLGAGVTLQQMNPLFAALVAFFFLREALGWKKLLLILGAFAGVVMIAQPLTLGGGQWNILGISLGLLSAAVAGAVYTFVRWLSGHEPVLRIVAWFSLVSVVTTSLMMFVPHPWQDLLAFQKPVGFEWFLLFFIAITTLGGQIFITKGLKSVPVAKATTIAMMQVPLAVGYDVIFFDQIPSMIRLAGIVLVTLSVVKMVRS